MTVPPDIYRQKIHDLDRTSTGGEFWPVPSLLLGGVLVPLSASVTKESESMKPTSLGWKVDSLIFGLYPLSLLRPLFKMSWSPKVQLIDSGAECIRDISVLLEYFEINQWSRCGPLHHRFTQQPAAKVLHKLVKNGWKKRFMWSM